MYTFYYITYSNTEHLFKYIENFNTKKKNFQMKNSGIFIFLLKNIDCGYLLELPARQF